jgi:hypothetical protein
MDPSVVVGADDALAEDLRGGFIGLAGFCGGWFAGTFARIGYDPPAFFFLGRGGGVFDEDPG